MTNKILLAFTTLLLIASFSSCAVQKEQPLIEASELSKDMEITVTDTSALLEPEETTADEATFEETTTAAVTTQPISTETQIVYEYKVEGGSVWIGKNEPKETDETMLISTTVIYSEEYERVPEEDSTDSVESTETTYVPLESEAYTTSTENDDEAVTPPDKSYDTDGTYFPISTMYHSISEEPFTSLTGLFVRPADLEDQLITLNALGYEFIFADEFAYSDTPTIMLTFDDGYEDNYTELFPLLKKYNSKATIFMITSAIDSEGYLSSEQIKEMAESGLVRFASHTHDHVSLTSLSEDAIRYQFATSKRILTELTGYEMNAVCYPGGSVSDEIAEIAAEYFNFGYTTVSSAYTYGCDPLLIPRVRVSRGVSGSGLAYLIGAKQGEY